MSKHFGNRYDRRPGDTAGRHGRSRRPDGDRPGRTAGGPRQGPDRSGQRPGGPAPTSWDHVASWYDKLVGEEGSDYHKNVVLPAALRLLEPAAGEKVLDLCCGQGVFCRQLAQLPVKEIVGVDASPSLIRAAQQREHDPKIRYVVGDARNLGELADGSFDAAACLMAVHDLDDIEATFASLARALRPPPRLTDPADREPGRAVVIFMHPCFRIPRQSSWGWDDEKKMQYRRLDRYYSPMTIPIATHPGSEPGTQTLFFHRPLSAYMNALGRAGLAVVECEELLSHHKSEPGGHSRGENRSRQEFPVFLALKAMRIGP